MQTKPFRIGTRGSPLALAQAYQTRDRLMAAHALPEEMFEIVPIITKGDRIADRPLSEVGGKGLFTEELEHQLLTGELDFAVHSAKDMATQLPQGLYLSTFLPREDPRDAYIGKTAAKLLELPHGATVGSASLRRQALIRRLRPDLNVIIFRGAVATRLRKLEEGQADATLLAVAGLNRLGLEEVITEILNPQDFLPAPAQGAIGIESRKGDKHIDNLLSAINDSLTMDAVVCERAFLSVLDGSCRTPIAGHAMIDGEHLSFKGLILTPDGQTSHAVEISGKRSEAIELGRQAGEKVRKQAGTSFFEGWG